MISTDTGYKLYADSLEAAVKELQKLIEPTNELLLEKSSQHFLDLISELYDKNLLQQTIIPEICGVEPYFSISDFNLNHQSLLSIFHTKNFLDTPTDDSSPFFEKDSYYKIYLYIYPEMFKDHNKTYFLFNIFGESNKNLQRVLNKNKKIKISPQAEWNDFLIKYQEIEGVKLLLSKQSIKLHPFNLESAVQLLPKFILENPIKKRITKLIDDKTVINMLKAENIDIFNITPLEILNKKNNLIWQAINILEELNFENLEENFIEIIKKAKYKQEFLSFSNSLNNIQQSNKIKLKI